MMCQGAAIYPVRKKETKRVEEIRVILEPQTPNTFLLCSLPVMLRLGRKKEWMNEWMKESRQWRSKRWHQVQFPHSNSNTENTGDHRSSKKKVKETFYTPNTPNYTQEIKKTRNEKSMPCSCVWNVASANPTQEPIREPSKRQNRQSSHAEEEAERLAFVSRECSVAGCAFKLYSRPGKANEEGKD